MVTVPLENALNGVPGIDVMRSKSVAQLSSIVLIFKPGADEIRARQLVRSGWRSRPSPADVGRAAVHDAAAVLDQPGHEDRHYLRRTSP